MTPNSHFKELLSVLDRCGAKYLVVGGYAVMLYTEPRYTKDLDIWVEASPENALLVFKALAEFGAPLAGIHAEDFTTPDLIYQLGVAPSRIDVLTSISGVSFEDAWTRRKEADFGDVLALFISLEDPGQRVDLADCERLEDAKDLL